MPHVSRKKLDTKTTKHLKEILSVVLSNLDSKSAEIVVNSLLTQTERNMLSKRLMIWLMLDAGHTPTEISNITKSTLQTVERLNYQFKEIRPSSRKVVLKKLNNWFTKSNIKDEIEKILSQPSPSKHIKKTFKIY
jgi:uncharacterized protein YerC